MDYKQHHAVLYAHIACFNYMHTRTVVPELHLKCHTPYSFIRRSYWFTLLRQLPNYLSPVNKREITSW